MAGGSVGKGPISGINITPMVDILLVLLVVMFVSATYIVSKSMKVELPKAVSGGESVSSIAAVTVSKDGAYYFNNKPVSDTELTEQLRDSYAKNPEINLIITADKNCKYDRVVHVVDVARVENIVKFALNVETSK
jgi:biopolymer transport protein ExbD